MSYTVINTTSKGSVNGSGVTTDVKDTTAADLIVIYIADYAAATANSVSDSKSNTWTPRTAYTSAGTAARGRFFYCQAPATDANHTFTYSGANTNFPSIHVLWASGSKASPYDTENGAGGSTSSAQTGSVSPAEDNELLVTGATIWQMATGTPTIDFSFTVGSFSYIVPGSGFGGGIGYLVETSAASKNPTWSFTGAVDSVAVIATFKSAAVATGIPNKIFKVSQAVNRGSTY